MTAEPRVAPPCARCDERGFVTVFDDLGTVAPARYCICRAGVEFREKNRTVVPVLRERSEPQLDILALEKDDLQNVMSSMQAMASAQLRRFAAAGVLVLVFDKTGTALQVFEKPERDAITDDYARAAVAQLCGIDVSRKAKRKR